MLDYKSPFQSTLNSIASYHIVAAYNFTGFLSSWAASTAGRLSTVVLYTGSPPLYLVGYVVVHTVLGQTLSLSLSLLSAAKTTASDHR